MYDSVDVTSHAARRELAEIIRAHAGSLRDAWSQSIVEQSPYAGDIPAGLLDAYLAALAQYIEDPDRSTVSALAATWCDTLPITTQSVAATAVAMGLLCEAFRRGLTGNGVVDLEGAMSSACSVLPDFSAEFVRGLMRGDDFAAGEQHWYEVSKQLREERERKITQLAILNEVTAALSSTLSLDDLYQIIYQQCSRLVDTSFFYIATLGPGPDQMTMKLHYFDGRLAERPELHWPKMGLTRVVVESGEPLLVGDYMEACNQRGIPPWLPGLEHERPLAWLGVPIIGDGTPLGVLVVMSRKGLFDDGDVEVLKAVARQAGAAIKNAQLYEAQRRQANQLRAINQLSRVIATIREPEELMPKACDLIKETFGFAIVSILLAHPDNNQLMLRSQTSREGLEEPLGITFEIGGPGLISRAAVTRRPVLSNNVSEDPHYLRMASSRGIESELSVPLLRDDRLLGVLDIQSPELNAFTEQDVDLLSTIAEQLAIALENAELLVQERKRRSELALILEVARAANSSLVLDDVIQRVAEGLSDALSLASCVVYLYDDEGDRLLPSSFVAREGSRLDTSRISQLAPSPEQSQLLRRIFLSGQEACAIEMKDCDVDDDLARVLNASAVLSVPFVVKQQFLGFALLAAHDEDYRFTQHQVRVACGIAGAAALALENAQLYARSHTLGRAEERIRVARDIHDGIAQGLTAISLHLEAAEQMFVHKPEKSRAKIGRALELTRTNLEDARRSVLDLHSSALEELTLTEALHRRIHQFLSDQTDRPVTATFSGDAMYGRLSSRMELSLYRIFEEALENIARHADATHVDVVIERHGDDVVLTVRDNGRGFDADKALSGQGVPGAFGLVAVRERVRLLRGNLQVQSSRDGGTQLVVKVPFEPHHEDVVELQPVEKPAQLAVDGMRA